VTELWGDGMNQGRHPGLDPGSVEDGILAYTDAVVRQAHQPAQHDDFCLYRPCGSTSSPTSSGCRMTKGGKCKCGRDWSTAAGVLAEREWSDSGSAESP